MGTQKTEETGKMKKWLCDLFNAVDNKDADAFVSFLTEDASFKFANAPAVTNRENIHKAVSQFFSAVNGVRHEIKTAWELDNAVICEGQVTYTRHDASKASFPFVNILRMKNELIADYRVYIDNSPLFT